MKITLSEYLQTLKNEQNSVHVAYIEKCIANGWTPKQMRARFKQSRDAMDWQAKHGAMTHREGNRASADLFTAVIDFLNRQTEEVEG